MAQILTFLKLGGSLITNKSKESTVNTPILRSACEQIAQFIKLNPEQPLLLGHGSGSFGHFAAAKYSTKQGFDPQSDPETKRKYWDGFKEVYRQASDLNNIVMSELRLAGVSAIAFSPNASITSANRTITEWNLNPIRSALQNGIMPVVYGDVVFDQALGGTILSTEDLFEYLAIQLSPDRVLLAGIEEGVWTDFPNNQHLIKTIDIQSYARITALISGSAAVDVTGGMDSKVSQMLSLTNSLPNLQARVFSGVYEKNIYSALNGSPIGTLICR